MSSRSSAIPIAGTPRSSSAETCTSRTDPIFRSTSGHAACTSPERRRQPASPAPGFLHARNSLHTPGVVGTWRLTDKGKAAAANVDPKATTQKDCIPVGAPTLMLYPVANTITVERDRVVMNVDWMESQRIIYLDGRQHPPASQTFLHGHSVGRWEDKMLVVDTTNFTGARQRALAVDAGQRAETPHRAIRGFGGWQDIDLLRRGRRSRVPDAAGSVVGEVGVSAEHASLESEM